MKNKIFIIVATAMVLSSFTACSNGTENNKTEESSEAQAAVADTNETAPQNELDTSNLTPISGSEIADGEYDIDVESSSTMFNIESCKLTVNNGKMTAAMTMGGTGYKYIYPGTGVEAAKADSSEYIKPESVDGKDVFTLEIKNLDEIVPCSAFSKRKEKWYDRNLIFKSNNIPSDKISDSNSVKIADLDLSDGDYTCEVTLKGGSGRASVDSPCDIKIADDKATAKIVWSSPNYDYMIVDDEKYLPTNTDGNSTFEIPIDTLGKVNVKADTTAMSQPYEIDYTLNFAADSIKAK